MRLTVTILGLPVLDIDLSADSPSPEPDAGDAVSVPVGFTARFERVDEGEW